MTKKITILLTVMLLFGLASYSQTATIATVTASPGENISVPMTVTDFTDISAITLYVRFNPDVLSFTGLQNTATTGFMANVTDSTINIVWTASPPTWLTIASGTLLELNFTYNGMTAGNLTFLGGCEVTQGAGATPVNVTYTNGAVNPNSANAATATIVSATGSTGSTVAIPIMYNGFGNDVGAITQYVEYDPGQLTFINVTTLGTLAGVNANASGGVIAITWSNTGGTSINWPTNQLVLNFLYIGGSTTNLNFESGCLISTTLGATIPVSYFNGVVSPGTPTATAVLGSITGTAQGQDVEVPLTLTSFPSGSPSGTAAMTLKISFDSPKLSFIGVVDAAQPVNVNVNGNIITIAWTDVTAPDINGEFLKLKFKYNGVGEADVAFGNGCLFSTLLGTTIFVGYTDATVTPAVATANANISDVVNASNNTVVEVPVSFDGLPTNMGAATMYIGYDTDKLTYIEATDNTHGASVNNINNQIIITWASAVATDLNGEFLKLKFLYSTTGDCGAAIYFNDGCELADITATIVPANWNDGGVNVKFMISGYLRYNGAPRPDTITLRHVPIDVKTSPGGVVVESTTTDATGYYEVYVANGSYTLEASTSKTWGGVTALDGLLVRLKVIAGNPFPDENALRLTAADVDQSGAITALDGLLIRIRVSTGTKPASWTQPDWVFEVPAVVIDCDGETQNFWGICSGDVNGSYPNPIP
ncbi:MAG: hypothetical protein HQ542_01095 [Bacteroidia bacterium]|nr:hypothetical protein [Bacteroidia bacterium]